MLYNVTLRTVQIGDIYLRDGNTEIDDGKAISSSLFPRLRAVLLSAEQSHKYNEGIIISTNVIQSELLIIAWSIFMFFQSAYSKFCYSPKNVSFE